MISMHDPGIKYGPALFRLYLKFILDVFLELLMDLELNCNDRKQARVNLPLSCGNLFSNGQRSIGRR